MIERPASVIKELVENSIDAGARRISIHVRDGGRSLIQVIDDGCGMDRDDAILCVEPHATSKIHEVVDIERIVTMGFRGEALPSIAAVSRFQLQTRRPDDLSGTEVVIEGGTVRDVRDCGCAPGTSIRIRQLFYNMPGRRKFLRGAVTESEHIHEVALLQALGHPEIGFELTLDGQQILQATTAAEPGARVAMLLGYDVFEAMLPVDYEESGVRVTGFVGRPGLTRASRREQRFFVNRRPATAETIFFGLREAYHTLVMKGRYPPAVLYLQLDPERVDVNVHPAKREVRFRESMQVGQVVAAAVRRSLRALADQVTSLPRLPQTAPALSAVPAFRLEQPPEQAILGLSGILTAPARPAVLPSSIPLAAMKTPLDNTATSETVPLSAGPPDLQPQPEPAPIAGGMSAEPKSTSGGGGTSPSSASREEIRQLRILGTCRDLYLVAEGSSGLVLVDQHAAHERILFEQLLAAAAEKTADRQPLLMPITVDLAPADAALLHRSLDHFIRLGFSLEVFGGNTYLVTAVPTRFPQENIAGLLRDILDELRQSPGGATRPDEVQIAQAACKHAVKAEDPLTPVEIARLLKDLAETRMPYTCPHGRPVMITIPSSELEKRFGRRS